MDWESLKQAVTKMANGGAEVRPKPYIEPTPEESLFLKRIAAIESSSGTDTDHPEITSGIQKDTRAVGQYGLMPNTLEETYKRADNEKDLGPNLGKLKGMTPQQMADAVAQDPDLEQEMAIRLNRRIMSRPGVKTDDQANYMWQYGHNLDGARLKERNYQDSDRAQKFQKLKAQIK